MQTNNWKYIRNQIIRAAEYFLPKGLPASEVSDYVRLVVVILGAIAITLSYIPFYLFWNHEAAGPGILNCCLCLIFFISALFILSRGYLLFSIGMMIFGGMINIAIAALIFGKAMNIHVYMSLVASAVIVIHPKDKRWLALLYGALGLLVLLALEILLPDKPYLGAALSSTVTRLSTFQAMALTYAGQLAFTWWFQVHGEKISEELARERERSENLLLNILPESIADRLKEGQVDVADGFDNVTVLFADIVNFTEVANRLTPHQLVHFLNQVFTHFDELTHEFGLEKIKTIGDAYMVAGGIPEKREDHADAVMKLGLAMLAYTQNVKAPTGDPIMLRIGINSGPVVAGVIGVRKFIYDLWGDTVNLAARLESSGMVNRIQVSSSTHRLLKDKYAFEQRDAIKLKGLGMTETYLFVSDEALMLNLNNAS